MSTMKTTGYIIALIASLVALLAFFVMPYISVGFFGSATGVQIVTTIIQALQISSSSPFNPGNNQATWLLLIVLLPVVAAITALIAGVQMSRGRRAGKAGAAWLIILGGLILAGLGVLYFYLSSVTPAGFPISITSLLGIGYWVNLLAMIAVIIGGILALKTAIPVVPQPWSQAPAWSSSQQQWPPSQFPPQAQPWHQPQQQWPPSQSSPQWPSTQSAPPSQQWPPTQNSQSSPQQPPWQ